MTTDELSIRGYCCTGSDDNALHPARRMTRLTTTARTGCLMKMSVIERMSVLPAAHDRDERGLAKLERAGRRDLLARREPTMDHDLVTQHRAALDRARMDAGRAVLLRRDHEDVVSARSLAQGVHRNRDRRLRRSDRNTDTHRRARSGCPGIGREL